MDGITGRILVVDDEENIRKILQRTLQLEGYDVVTAANGRDALSQIEQMDIAVMILDMKMPGMSGIEVLQEASARWPEICVIMLTANDDIDTAVEVMKLGAYDYITKPFKRGDLNLKLQKAIEQRNLIAQQGASIENQSRTWPTGLNPDDWVE